MKPAKPWANLFISYFYIKRENIGRKIFGVVPCRRCSNVENKGIKAAILTLKEQGFFAEPKSLNEVHERLASYRHGSVNSALHTLSKEGHLDQKGCARRHKYSQNMRKPIASRQPQKQAQFRITKIQADPKMNLKEILAVFEPYIKSTGRIIIGSVLNGNGNNQQIWVNPELLPKYRDLKDTRRKMQASNGRVHFWKMLEAIDKLDFVDSGVSYDVVDDVVDEIDNFEEAKNGGCLRFFM